jgi:hypothetical protein
MGEVTLREPYADQAGKRLEDFVRRMQAED